MDICSVKKQDNDVHTTTKKQY